MRLLHVLLISALVLSGCANSFSSMIDGQGTSRGDVIPTYNTGGKAVTIYWLENSPPSKVKEDVDFQIGIELINHGYEDVSEGILKIWGCNNLTIEEGTNDIFTTDFSLRKTDINNPAGGRSQHFVTARGNWPREKCYLRAQVCYPYVTHLSKQICVDPNPASPDVNKPCKYEGEISVSAQAAPVTIDKIEHIISRADDGSGNVEYQFNIYPKNTGKGRIIEDGNWASQCSGSSEDLSSSLNVLKIVAWLGQKRMTCEPSIITLIPGVEEKKRNFFVCKVSVPAERGVFSSLLNAEIHYGYSYGSEMSIEIEGPPQKRFDIATTCPENQCKSRGPGVCDPVYGKQLTKMCSNGQICCSRAKPLCNDFSGFGCTTINCNPPAERQNTCPAGQYCCKTQTP